MKLDRAAELAKVNKTIDDVKKIYHGVDHVCRCGCAGRYFECGSRGFNRAMSRLQSPDFFVRPKGEVYYAPRRFCDVVCEGIDSTEIYVNIPEANTEDKCYCLYFEA